MSKILKIPKDFGPSKIEQFLEDAEFVFKLSGQKMEGFIFDVRRTEKICMLGILLTYKFIEFTVKNSCFKKPELFDPEDNYENLLKYYEFQDLIDRYVNQRSTERELKKLKPVEREGLFIAPQALIRADKKFTSDKIKERFYPLFKKYYQNEKVTRMIYSVFSEILMNFWSHATEDGRSVIMAEGNETRIEIACADNGNGIITTLKNSNNIKLNQPTDILTEAVKKDVTSKSLSNHMGYGLFMFDKISELSNSRLEIYSEGAFYKRIGKKVWCKNCGYWKGTIVYISLNLVKPITIEDYKEELTKKEIKINWS